MKAAKTVIWLAVTIPTLFGVYVLGGLSSHNRQAATEGPAVYVDLGDFSDAKGQDIWPAVRRVVVSRNLFSAGGELLLAGPCGECTRSKVEETPVKNSHGQPIIVLLENREVYDILTKKLHKLAVLDTGGVEGKTLKANFTPRRYLFDSSFRIINAETGNAEVDHSHGFDST